jgi:hypothetical protein
MMAGDAVEVLCARGAKLEWRAATVTLVRTPAAPEEFARCDVVFYADGRVEAAVHPRRLRVAPPADARST